jgi:hypothetical protein
MKPLFLILLTIQTFVFAQKSAVQENVDLRGRDCNGGLGICTASTTNKDQVVASFSKIESNKIAMSIDTQRLSEQNKASIFGAKYQENSKLENPTVFFQNADFQLEKTMLEQLGINTTLSVIRKGTYNALVENGIYKVVFTLFNK